MKRLCIFAAMLLFILTLYGCNSPFASYDGRPERLPVMQLQDIAYDVRWDRFYESKDEFTVYIRENGRWEPFLVLTANYPGEGNGEVLLLRRYLIYEARQWRAFNLITATEYYATSDIDAWLNTEYISWFSPGMQEQILTTHIETWDGRLVPNPRMPEHHVRTGTQIIQRQIFLLSFTEMGGEVWHSDAVEGEVLDYFNLDFIRRSSRRRLSLEEQGILHRERFSTTTRCGDTNSVRNPITNATAGGTWWWLRSRRASIVGNTVGIVRENLHVGGESGFIRVRPALCLPRNTPIYLVELDGRWVYAIRD